MQLPGEQSGLRIARIALCFFNSLRIWLHGAKIASTVWGQAGEKRECERRRGEREGRGRQRRTRRKREQMSIRINEIGEDGENKNDNEMKKNIIQVVR
jgi:hypothetical protein